MHEGRHSSRGWPAYSIEIGCARVLVSVVVDRSVVDERIAASEMIGDPARGHCHALVVVDVQLDGVYFRMTQSCHRRLPALGITRAQHHPVTSLRKLAADFEADAAVAACDNGYGKIGGAR